MKKGAVPIPYIIALLLGIAVVAILGYWFFVLGGTIGGEITLERCRTRAHTYCATWQATGYATYENKPATLRGWFSDTYPACESYEASFGFTGDDVVEDKEACQLLLGAETGGTSNGGLEGPTFEDEEM